MAKASREYEQFHAIVIEKMMLDATTNVKMFMTKQIILWRCFHCGTMTYHEKTSGDGWRCIYTYQHKKGNE